jgi:hypothetical protein
MASASTSIQAQTQAQLRLCLSRWPHDDGEHAALLFCFYMPGFCVKKEKKTAMLAISCEVTWAGKRAFWWFWVV